MKMAPGHLSARGPWPANYFRKGGRWVNWRGSARSMPIRFQGIAARCVHPGSGAGVEWSSMRTSGLACIGDFGARDLSFRYEDLRPCMTRPPYPENTAPAKSSAGRSSGGGLRAPAARSGARAVAAGMGGLRGRRQIGLRVLPTTSIVSLLYVMDDGASAEIAVTGNDGLVGIALFMGGETTPSRAVVQSAGYGYRLKASGAEKGIRSGRRRCSIWRCATRRR